MQFVGDSEIPLLVSASTFKSAVHIDAGDLTDDGHIELFLGAAQEVVSTAVGIPPSPGPYEFEIGFSAAGWRRFWFPARPVVEITEVAVTDADGAWAVQDLTGVRLVDGFNEPQMLLPTSWSGFVSGTDRMRIRATLGNATPPKQMSQAIILMVKEWLEAGIAIEERFEAPRLSFGVYRLIKQIRYQRPRIIGCD